MATSSTRKTTKKTTTRATARKTAESRGAKKEESEEEAAAEKPVKRPRGRPKKQTEDSIATSEAAGTEKPRRGRKPKTLVAEEADATPKTTRDRKKTAATVSEAESTPPKRRGRPSKVKTEETEEKPAPKRRGRPPKAKTQEVEAVATAEEKPAPKRRGRPPKTTATTEVAPGEETPPAKRRGRKPRIVTEAEAAEAAPKKTGRPAKSAQKAGETPNNKQKQSQHDPQPQLLFEEDTAGQSKVSQTPQTSADGRKAPAKAEEANASQKKRGDKGTSQKHDEKEEAKTTIPALPQVNLDKVPREFLQLGLREHTAASMAKVVDTLPEEAVTSLRILGKNQNSCIKLENREMQVFLAVVGALNNVVNWIAQGEKEVASLILVSTTQQVKDTYECATALSPLKEICVVSDPEKVLGVETQPSILILTANQAEQLVQEEKLSLSRVSNITTVDTQSILDAGYEKSLCNLLEGVQNPDAQKVVFSDNFKINLRELIYLHVDSPVFPFLVESEEKLKSAPQWGFPVTTPEKLEYLLGFMQKHNPKTALIFCNTKNVADWLAYKLAGNNIYTELTSWKYPAHKRNILKEKIDKGSVKAVVTTDNENQSFANSNISHVYHFDLAPSREAHLNRVSQGTHGDDIAQNVLFVCDSYGANLITLEEELGSKVFKKEAPQYARVPDRCNEAFDDMGRVKPLWEAIQFSKTLSKEKPRTPIREASAAELEQTGKDVIDTLRKLEKEGSSDNNKRQPPKTEHDDKPQRQTEPQKGQQDHRENPRKIVGGKTIRTDKGDSPDRLTRDRSNPDRTPQQEETTRRVTTQNQGMTAHSPEKSVGGEDNKAQPSPHTSRRSQYTREQAVQKDSSVAQNDPYTLEEEERKAVDSYRNSRRNDSKRRNHLQYDMAKEMIDAAKQKANKRSRKNQEQDPSQAKQQSSKHLNDAVGLVEHIEESLENLQETVREEIKKRPLLKKLANRFFGGNKRS